MPEYNLSCRNCRVPLASPSYNLTYKQREERMCKECRGEISRNKGRIPSQHNATVVVTAAAEQVILGSVLGDGHLEIPPPGGIHWGLDFKHSLKQRAYAEWKAVLLGSLVSSCKITNDKARVRSIRHPYLTQLAKYCIRDGRRVVSERLLRLLEPLGFAVWYLDDGNLSVRGKRITIRFATCNFRPEENLRLRAELSSRLGVRTGRCTWSTKHALYEGISLEGINALTFLEFIQPVVAGCPVMDYKLKTEAVNV